MKKFASLALVLAFTGATAFAQDPALKVTGYVNSGVKIVNADDVTTFQNYANDWDDAGTWGTIGVEYAGAKSGFSLVLAASTILWDTDGDDVADSAVGIDTAYGWVSPLEGLKLFGGTSYSGVFDALDDNGEDYFSVTGVSFTYSIMGLTVGAGTVLPPFAVESTNVVGGAGYALEGVGEIRASLLSSTEELDSVAVSASVSAVPGLTLNGGYWVTGLADEEEAALDATVGYAITEALSAQVVVYDFITAEYFTVTPSATYTFIPGLSATVQVEVKTEGEDDVVHYATYIPELSVSYAIDAASTISAYVNYDTDAEVTTFDLDFLFSF